MEESIEELVAQEEQSEDLSEMADDLIHCWTVLGVN